MRAKYFSALLLGGLATASPVAVRQAPTPTATAAAGAGTTGTATGTGVDMAAALLAVMPSSGSCAGAQFPDECRTAEQAAPFVSKACADLGAAECAATVAVMGLESGELKYKHNVFPGVPGQGTANMMSPTFVSEYATDLFGADAVAGKAPADVLALVTPDEHNFGSAAWFLTTKCAGARDSFKTGSDAGWLAFNQCIGVDGSAGARMDYWVAAKKAFGL